jgi:hypothetical protein
VIYSEKYIGSKYDLPEEWRSWVEEDRLSSKALGNYIGHFGAEEGETNLMNVPNHHCYPLTMIHST